MPRLSAAEVVANQKAHRAYVAARAMHTVHEAARLRNLAREVREAGREKQEPSQIAVQEGSTAPNLGAQIRRAASAQSDTNG